MYLIAIGGAAYLVSKAIKSSRVLAFADLGMEAIYEFDVKDMPVTVAVDKQGNQRPHHRPRGVVTPHRRHTHSAMTDKAGPRRLAFLLSSRREPAVVFGQQLRRWRAKNLHHGLRQFLIGVLQQQADLPHLGVRKHMCVRRHAGESNSVRHLPIGLTGLIVAHPDHPVTAVALPKLRGRWETCASQTRRRGRGCRDNWRTVRDKHAHPTRRHLR